MRKVNESYYSFCVKYPLESLNEEIVLVNNLLREYYFSTWRLIGDIPKYDFAFASSHTHDPMMNLALLTQLSKKDIWFKNLQYSLIPGMFVFKLDLI